MRVYEPPTFRIAAEDLERIGSFNVVHWSMIGYEPTFIVSRLGLSSIVLRSITALTGIGPAFLVPRPGVASHAIESVPGLLNSTDAALGIARVVDAKLAESTAEAQEEWFEDGVESRLSRTLTTLLHGYGDSVVTAVERLLGLLTVNIEVAVEAAQWLGEVDDVSSQHYRRTLLEKILLSAPTTRLRHGAAAGLAAMNDPASLRAIVEARDREGNRRLRYFLELVVDQLERARACRS